MSSPSTYMPSTNSGIPSFSSLGGGPTRWGSFITGFGLQVALVIAATTLTITATAPQLLEQTYDHIELTAPLVPRPEPYMPPRTFAPPPKLIVRQTPKIDPVVAPPMAIPVRPDRKPLIPDTVAKLPSAPQPKFDSPVVDKPAGPKVSRAVLSSAFTGSSATPTLKNTPAHLVQTGGFGDPNGVPANDDSRGRANIARLGSFDLPRGDGQGNGSGGTRGLRGTVASAGFGNGLATEGGGGGRGTGKQGVVQGTAFASAQPTPEITKKKSIVEAPLVPASITSKPTPVYTEEARKLHVEGEVLVRVVLTASGQVRVLQIVRGLGHGLDDAAIRAAEGIRFIPAQREGQAVDSNATLHIVFQLS